MRVRFRGVDVREAVLCRGPLGLGRVRALRRSTTDVEAARWLAAGVEAAYAAWPAPVRDVVPVNATVPAVGPEQVPAVLARFDGCTTAKVKVAERGQTLADDLDRVAAVRDAMGPSARASGSTPTAAGRRRRRRGAGQARGLRPRVRRAALRHGRGARRAAKGLGAQRDRRARSRPTSRSARPRTRSAWRAGGGRPRRRQGRAARRGARGSRDRRGVRAAGRRVVGARHERRHRRRGGARGGAARRSSTRAASAPWASSSGTSSATPLAPDGRSADDRACRAGPGGARGAGRPAGAAAVVARPARPLPRGARGRGRPVIKACLNGDRTRRQHRIVPQTPDELARAAADARRGRRVHGARAPAGRVRSRDAARRGTSSMPSTAIRAVTPGLRVSVSTRDGIVDGARASSPACREWPSPDLGGPDCASVNWHEDGAARGRSSACATTGSGSRQASGPLGRRSVRRRRTGRGRSSACSSSSIPGVTPGSDGPWAAERILAALGMSPAPVLVHGEGRWAWPVLRWAQAVGLRRAHRPGGHPLPARTARGARQRRARRGGRSSRSRARRRSGRCPTRSDAAPADLPAVRVSGAPSWLGAARPAGPARAARRPRPPVGARDGDLEHPDARGRLGQGGGEPTEVVDAFVCRVVRRAQRREVGAVRGREDALEGAGIAAVALLEGAEDRAAVVAEHDEGEVRAALAAAR